MTVKAKIGVLVMALLEDDYNKTGHMRPAATAAAQRIADLIWASTGTSSTPGSSRRSTRRQPRPSLQRAGRRHHRGHGAGLHQGHRPGSRLIDTTAPVLVWNAQSIARLGESDGFDVVMLNSGMAGIPELTAVLLRTGRDFTMVTSRLDDPEGRRKVPTSSLPPPSDAACGRPGSPSSGIRSRA